MPERRPTAPGQRGGPTPVATSRADRSWSRKWLRVRSPSTNQRGADRAVGGGTFPNSRPPTLCQGTMHDRKSVRRDPATRSRYAFARLPSFHGGGSSGPAAPLRSLKCKLQTIEDVVESMIGLVKLTVRIVTVNIARQNLVPMVELPAIPGERLCCGSPRTAKLCKFYSGVKNLQDIGDFCSDLLRPMLAGTFLWILEQPGRRVFKFAAVPKLSLAAECFLPQHPFRLDLYDAVRIRVPQHGPILAFRPTEGQALRCAAARC